MLVGYNTNVPYKGNLYHVQTEDSGIKNPVIITLLYIKGTILASKKVSYADIVSSPDYKEKVRELMKNQHKAMMKELISGKHTGETENSPPNTPKNTAETKSPALTPAPAQEEEQQEQQKQDGDRDQISRSLDDILLDFIINKGK